MLVGYARVSTSDQDLTLHTDALTKAGERIDVVLNLKISDNTVAQRLYSGLGMKWVERQIVYHK